MIYGILHFLRSTLQQDSLSVWGNKDKTLAQSKLLHRAKMNSLASQGLIN